MKTRWFNKLLSRSARRNKARTAHVSPVYQNYEAALQDAGGYEDEELVRVVVAKSAIFKNSLVSENRLDIGALRISVALAVALRGQSLSVLDFGGGAGGHYFTARKILGEDVKLDWRVVETNRMVQEARLQGIENDELKFYSSVQSASAEGRVNLIFASGSLQYTSNPHSFLRELSELAADFLVITRTPLAEESAVILQHSKLSHNGIGKIPADLNVQDRIVTYPVTILDRKGVEEVLNNFGEVVFQIDEDKVAYASEKGTYDMFGFVVKCQRLP